jgi:hypothetical protein
MMKNDVRRMLAAVVVIIGLTAVVLGVLQLWTYLDPRVVFVP